MSDLTFVLEFLICYDAIGDENMNENFKELYEQFQKIKEQGWIRVPTNQKVSQGVFFEQLLKKPIENFEIPDFDGIEIKTHLKDSKSYITLFNASPDGDSFFEIERICSQYGYPDTVLKHAKILHGNVNVMKRNFIGIKYQFRLSLNTKKKKLILYIYDRTNKVVDKSSYWSFELLEEKLRRKLRYLAYIDAKKKVINQQVYYRYNQIYFYQLKDFDQFLELLEKGIIMITFTVGVFREGKRKGQIHNHGTAFRISREHLGKLFSQIYP